MTHKWKRLLCIGAALTLTGQMYPVQMLGGGTALVANAVDYEEYTEDGITYAVYDDHAEVIAAKDTLTNAFIYSVVKGKIVTEIGKNAFYGYHNLKSVHIPDTVEKIGIFAFALCDSLKGVKIPDSVSTIGAFAFYECSFSDLYIGKNLSQIGWGAFSSGSVDAITVDPQNEYYVYENQGLFSKDRTCLVCVTSDVKDYDIPDGTQDISDAFRLSDLVSVRVPGSVDSIDAFNGCTSLKDVTLEEGMTNLGSGFFSGCKSLENIKLPQTMKTIGEYAFLNCSSLKALEFPASVKSVADCALKGCSSLSAVTFRNPNCEIGNLFNDMKFSGAISGYEGSTAEAYANKHGYAFISLGKMSEIDLSGLEDGASIRYSQSGLTFDVYNDHAVLVDADDVFTDLVIPDTMLGVPVTVIAELACKELTKLKSVQIPGTVTEISGMSFNDCSSLENVQFSEGLKVLEYCAFQHCNALTAINLPASLEEYDDGFAYCTGITEINAAAESEYFKTVKGVLYSKDMTYLYQIPGSFSESYALPDSVQVIYDRAAAGCHTMTDFQIGRNSNLHTICYSAFAYCTGLTSFSMPDTVTEMEPYAFYNCANLKQIRLSNHLQKIPFNTFDKCYKLESFNVPASVEMIGTFALGEAESLKSLVFQNPETEIYQPISGTEFNGTVYGYANSTAQTFAEEKGYPFVDIASLTDVTLDGIQYQISDGKATVVGYEDGITEAHILEYVYGVPVTAIADHALQGCTTLKTLTLSEGLTTIGDFAFDSCYYLEGTVSIPDSVETIGVNAFAECCNVTGIDFGESLFTANQNCKLTEIGPSAFSSCTKLASVILPKSVKTIGTSAFEDCDSLLLAVCGTHVETIGADAFAGCKKLTLLSLGSNLKTIGDRAFENCSALLAVTIPETTESIGDEAFAGCSYNSFGICFDNPNTEIFDAATTICGERSPAAFSGTICGYSDSTAEAYAEKYGYTFKLQSDDGKDQVVRDKITYQLYDDHAEVIDCEDTVQKAEIRSSVRGLPVTAIAEDAFNGLTALETVVIPDSVREISAFAFMDCTALASVYFGNGIEEIGGFAFMNTAISSLTLPDSVKMVGNFAFNGAASLSTVTIGKGLTELDTGAFLLTDSLHTFVVDEENTSFKVQDGLLYSADGTRIYAAPCNLKEYEIPDGVTDIQNVFCGLQYLTSITVPASVTASDYAFQGCTALEDADIYAETIGKSMFAGCTSLEIVWLENIRGVDTAAFQNCGQLKSIDLGGCESIGESAFGACPTLEAVYFYNPDCVISSELFKVNDASLTESPFTGTIYGYESSTAQTFAEENNYTFESFGKVYGYLIYEVNDGQITITGYTYALPETAEIPAEIEGMPVVSIGDSAFFKSKQLKEIRLPDTLTYIGKQAFCYSGLQHVTIPESVKTINEYTFYTTYLKEITIPESVETIKDYAFYWTDLTEVTVPASVKTIGKYAFSECDYLEKVTVGAETIGVGAFYYSWSLKDITILDTVKNIGEGAFENCNALTEVTIPDTVEIIEANSFNFNADLEKITVGAKETGKYVFSSNPNLKEVTFTDNVETIGELTFYNSELIDTVEFPASVKTIGAKQFMDATAMNAGGKVIIRNPYCDLDEDMLTSDFKGTVYGYSGSTAQGYCDYFGFRFVPICNVTFECGPGTGDMPGYEVFGQIKLPECGFKAPAGKAFAGWSTGDGATYPVGMTLTLTGDTILTAVWQAVTCIVKFDANGGTGSMGSATLTSGSVFTFPACTFTAPEDNQFVGWQIGEKTYQPGDSFKITKGATVKALWEEIRYQIAFDGNGGAGTMEGLSVLPDTEFTLPENTFEAPEGGTFDKWMVGKKTYNPGEAITITEDTTIIAIWHYEPAPLTILIGDVNVDGLVNQIDAIVLSRYAAGWEDVDIYLNAADLNEDGTVDNADAMILSRYVAGWADYDKYIVSKTV